jgi:hypothetical protein
MNYLDSDLQRRIIAVRMTQILGDEIRARVWMRTLQETFKDPSTGAWRTANELIACGQYARVLAATDKLATGSH